MSAPPKTPVPCTTLLDFGNLLIRAQRVSSQVLGAAPLFNGSYACTALFLTVGRVLRESANSNVFFKCPDLSSNNARHWSVLLYVAL